MYYIPQIQKDDCGFACLKIVLANLHNDKNYLFLPQDESHGFYSFTDLIKIGKEYGVTFTPFRATERATIVNGAKFPLIAVIVAKNEARHAVVVTKAKGKKVQYLDPRKGTVNCSLMDFLSIWDGTGLMVESFNKMKCPCPALNPIKKATHVGLSLMEFAAGVFAVLGVYFIKDDTPIYLPIIFFSLAIIVEIILKISTYRVMKGLDSYFFNNDHLPKKNYNDYLYRFENYKKLVLSGPMNYILTLVFTLALAMVTMLNDQKNILLIFVPTLLCLFRYVYIRPALKKKNNQILELEEELDGAQDLSDVKRCVKQIHDKAYAYSYLDIISRYVFAGIIIAVTLLVMHLSGISSVPYLIFYTCISVLFYRSLTQLCSFDERVEEFNLVKIKIINAMHQAKENK